MSTTFTQEWLTRTFTVVECFKCACPNGLPDRLYEACHDKKIRDFYCVQCGARQGWSGKSKAEKARDRAERRLSDERAHNTHLRDQLQATKRSHAATKGQLTKTKKRVAAGVCPCCNRSFKDLARHMTGQHPDYVA